MVLEHGPGPLPERIEVMVGERRVGDDEGAPAPPALGKEMTRLRQCRDRFSQGRAGDAKLGRQLALRREATARRKQAEPDRRAEPLDRFLERRRGSHWLKDRLESGVALHRLQRYLPTGATCAQRSPIAHENLCQSKSGVYAWAKRRWRSFDTWIRGGPCRVTRLIATLFSSIIDQP